MSSLVQRAGLVACTLLHACMTSWQPQQAPVAQLIATTGETEIQATLVGGFRVVLRDPGVEGDSLVGWLPPRGREVPVRQAYALNKVQSIAIRKGDAAPNLAAGLVTGVALGFALYGGLYLLVYGLCAASTCD